MRPSLLLRTLPALLVTGAVSFAQAQAQNPATGPAVVGRPGQPLGQPPSQPQEDRGPQLDFTFHNLPLVEVIHQIQTEYLKASGKHLNVMIPENLRDVAATNRIDVELKQISVPEVLDLLGMASRRLYRTEAHVNSAGQVVGAGSYGTSYSFKRVSSNEGTLTFLFAGEYPPQLTSTAAGTVNPQGSTPPRAERAVTPVEEPPPPRTVFFFSLDPYLDRYSVEDIITAVKTGWDLDGKKERPTLKYHDETKLLVASGDPFQVEMIKSVLMNLGRGSRAGGAQRTQPQAAPPAPSEPGVHPVPAKP